MLKLSYTLINQWLLVNPQNIFLKSLIIKMAYESDIDSKMSSLFQISFATVFEILNNF